MDQGSPESCRMSLTQSPSFGTPLLPTINNVLISYRQPGRPSSRAHHCPPNSDAATRSRAATTTTMAERPLSGPQGPEQVLFYGVDIQVAHFQCRPTCSLSTNSISLSFTEAPPPTHATPWASLFNGRPAVRLLQSPPAVERNHKRAGPALWGAPSLVTS